MNFAEPTLLWLALAAPAAAAAAFWLWRRRLAAESAWAARGLWDRLAAGHDPRRRRASVVLLALAVLGAAVALARPRWGSAVETVERHGVDVVFVLDSSLSMAAHDVPPSRLWAAKALIRRLAQEMPGNRVALVGAEGQGVVMTPLTVDGAIIDLLLDAIEPGSGPVPGTELAPALDAARGLFAGGGKGHRVIVLVSDGEDHGGGLATAAERLREEGVVVHALGVGTPAGAPVPLPEGDGDRSARLLGRSAADGRDGIKRDEEGEVVISRLDEAALESLSRETGGYYLRAVSAAVDTAPIQARIRRMETRAFDSETVTTLEERYQWPLGVSAGALLLALVLGPFARAPRRAVPQETAR